MQLLSDVAFLYVIYIQAGDVRNPRFLLPKLLRYIKNNEQAELSWAKPSLVWAELSLDLVWQKIRKTQIGLV